MAADVEHTEQGVGVWVTQTGAQAPFADTAARGATMDGGAHTWCNPGRR